ncbi:hypothetical protein J7E29_15495 [Streptomyces sp. ISL-90]|nr:hypothetical protein [Streptomyces sp. ISL-90]
MTRTDPDVQVLDDAARGRRRVWRDDAGQVVRVDLADATALRVRRDDEAGSFAVTADDGTPLVALSAPTAIPASLRANGLTPADAADIDGTHRLAATDPSGTTRTELRERTVRVERGGAVLRLDTDDAGRPRRVTAPGYDDLACRWSAGRWELGRLAGGVLLSVAESPDRAEYAAVVGGREVRWSERRGDTGARWSDKTGSPIVDVGLDPSGRVVSRRWHGGRALEYARDERGRLAGWSEARRGDGEGGGRDSDGPRTTVHARQYSGDELSALVTDGVRTVVRSEAGGRIRKLIGPLQTVAYDYDLNGRRTARTARGHVTRYAYDPLGQLTAVTTPERTVEYGWDALGRRVSVTVDGVGYREHRDPNGRLWSVTTAAGAPVCRFLWWDGRVVARCDADDAIDELYLTDPLGTLLGTATETSGWRFEDAIQHAFGRVDLDAGWRPTLFGHIADGFSGLICFGARELDPETGCFLTPDPWHGEDDDPRRLAGQPAATLPVETPSSGVHAYALSQYDPLGRPDRDGHFAVFNFILTLILGPTWGATLTSLSVFLFAPLNFYMEVVGLLGLFGGRHFWPQHSIFGLRLATGSSRLGTFGLALNGFVPRGFAGVGGDRCITIGYVAWESRHYFHMLDRPRVLELDDIAGTPGPDGKPLRNARRFSSTARGSILVITGKDGDGRKRVHGSWWTRGPGNAVSVQGGAQTFEDRVAPGGQHARGTVYLAQAMPTDMPAPRSASDGATLTVDEYLVAGGQSSTAELVSDVWFAVESGGDSAIAATTVLGVSAGSVATAYASVLAVVPGAKPVAILDHDLPNRFTSRPDVRGSVTLQKLTASTATSNGWIDRLGAVDHKKLDHTTAPGHPIAVGDVFKVAPATPDAAHPERPNAYTAVEAVSMALTVSPTLGGAGVTGATLYRLAPEGTAANGSYPDPTGSPSLVTFGKDQPFEADQFVQVTAGAITRFGRVLSVAASVPPVAAGPGGVPPGTPGKPASITLDEPLTGLPSGAVRVARLKESDHDKDLATSATQAGDVLTVKVTSTELFKADQAVLIDGAPRRVRQISAIGTIGVDTVDEVVGAMPFTLTKLATSGSTTSSKLASGRFLKHTGAGDKPSLYGTWSTAIMGVVPTTRKSDYDVDSQPGGWRFFLQVTPHPSDMHPDFSDYWQAVTVAGADYWLLSNELKIVKDGTDFYWEPDASDDHPRRHRVKINPTGSGAFELTVQGFVKSPVTRPDPTGGGRVFAYPAEAQVPEEPRARWSLADSLADHELTHTLQNTWWGPILGALPLQGAFRTVRDVLVANNASVGTRRFFDYSLLGDGAGVAGFEDSNWFELVSIGGLMQIAWSYVILGPVYLADKDKHKAIIQTNYADWSSVFNPVNQLIIDAIPEVQPGVESSKDWKVVLGRALTRALDMRSWTPFAGFIKLLLPDGPRNFLEQQASRKSGNLYSNILSVEDRFNAQLAVAPNLKNADLTRPLGDAVRLMSYFDGWGSRNLRLDSCDADGSAVVQLQDYFSSSKIGPILQFEPVSDTVLPADLYEPVPPPPPASPVVLATLQVDGPPGAGAGVVTRLLKVPAGTAMRPLLRSVVPIPPRVWGALGCYLVPGGPAVWKASALYPAGWAPKPDGDAHTHEATVTIDSTVNLGSEAVAWSEPAITGALPTGPKLARFVTEKEHLVVIGRNTTGWQAAADPGITLTPRPAGGGWDLSVDAPAAGAALPRDVRVRVWASVKPGDANLFDLDHPDVPTLAGHRSYLDDDFWLPIRDFLVTVSQLPTLPVGPAATMKANGSYDLDLPIKLAGPANIVPSGSLLQVSRDSDRPPRGERWKFTAATDRFVEVTQVVHVVVRFATGIERPFEITVDPNFTLDAAAFEATQAAPLVLTITGGTGPFTVVAQPPAASRATVTIAGTTATVTIGPPAPPPPPPPGAPITWRLVVRDSTGSQGARTLTLRP